MPEDLFPEGILALNVGFRACGPEALERLRCRAETLAQALRRRGPIQARAR